MRYQPECVGCSKNQGSRIYRIALGSPPNDESIPVPGELQAEINQQIDHADPCLSPADLGLMAIRTTQRYTHVADPFEALKKEQNQQALALYPELKQKVTESPSPLLTACHLAACGNIIDLGIRDQFDLHETIEKVLREGFRYNHFSMMLDEIIALHENGSPVRLLYFCDNAGEIVFDRIFIEALQERFPELHVTAVVRGAPVLNDATPVDAREAGLDQIAEVIDNGNERLGTVMAEAGDALRDAYSQASIMIAKGQANFETLSHQPERFYFILKAKCNVVARELGVNLLDAVMMRSPHATASILAPTCQ